RKFFEGFDFAMSSRPVNGGSVSIPTEKKETPKEKEIPKEKEKISSASLNAEQLAKEFSVYNLILAYRKKGHLIAKTNPIRERKDRGANLDLKYFGLSEDDLSKEFESGKFIGLGKVSLKKIVEHLVKCYAHHVGVEYNSLINQEKIDWLEKEVETTILKPFSLDQRSRILEKRNQGVMFEKFLHT